MSVPHSQGGQRWLPVRSVRLSDHLSRLPIATEPVVFNYQQPWSVIMQTRILTVAASICAAAAAIVCTPSVRSALADPPALSGSEQQFVQRMLTGKPDSGVAPLVLNPGRSVADLVQLGHTVVSDVRRGTSPFDEAGGLMRANPALTSKQGAWLITNALWLFDPDVARFYYTDTYAGVVPPGCWVIREIDLQCSS